MKTTKLYLAVALGLMLGFSSCNLDTFPSDELNSDLLLQDAKGAEYIMDGVYAILKDEVDFLGYASGNCYVRHYFQLSEYPSDNICLSAHTTDPLYEATAYMMNDGLKNVGTIWSYTSPTELRLIPSEEVVTRKGTPRLSRPYEYGCAYSVAICRCIKPRMK